MCGEEEGTRSVIQCTLCDRKYHDSCVDVTPEEHEESVAFICPRCEGSPLVNPLRKPARGRHELIDELPEEPWIEPTETTIVEDVQEPTPEEQVQDDGFVQHTIQAEVHAEHSPIREQRPTQAASDQGSGLEDEAPFVDVPLDDSAQTEDAGAPQASARDTPYVTVQEVTPHDTLPDVAVLLIPENPQSPTGGDLCKMC